MAVQKGMEVDDMKIETYWWGCELTAVDEHEWDMLVRLFDHKTMDVGDTYEWHSSEVEEMIVVDHEEKMVTVNR